MNITRKPDWVRMVENELRSDPRRLTAFDQIKELTALKCDAEFFRRYHTTLWCNRSWTCTRRSSVSLRVGRAFRSSAERARRMLL
jgi:hypothetical protein